ncbi:MAG: hypothetical protein OEL87_03090, partial [Nanoarchaeota archaeon]|nr:hypothetical protein [Nanoarchaeota archaeon]
KEPSLKEIFNNFTNLYSLKAYRDFAVHRGIIPQDKHISFEGKRYLTYNYGVPKITNSGRKYRVNRKHIIRLDYFCRLRFLELIYAINGMLSSSNDPEIIESAKKRLIKFDSRKVREVLRFLGRKTVFNDRSMIKEGELRKILNERGFRFEDLIEEDVAIQRMNDGMISADGKDMSYALRRTLFKPMGYFQVNKIENIYDRDWNPPKQIGTRYGIVDLSFELREIKNPKGGVKKIIESLVRLGLIIKLKDEEKFTLIDQNLQNIIGHLINLSQFKWSLISHPNFSYFREPNESEIESIKMIFGDKTQENIDRINKDREKIDKKSAFYKMEIKFLKNSKIKYSEMVKQEKKLILSTIKKNYNYLIPALKLINEDIFIKTPKLD